MGNCLTAIIEFFSFKRQAPVVDTRNRRETGIIRDNRGTSNVKYANMTVKESTNGITIQNAR